MKNKHIISALICISLLAFACKDNQVKPNDQPSNQTELITTMKIILNDSGTNQYDTFIFRDIDGEGGNAPDQIDTIQLLSGHQYYGTILLLDESKTVVDTISNEVLKEANDHLFVFKPSNGLAMVQYRDKDSNLLPIGLRTFWICSLTPTFGHISIILKHQPGVKNGTETPGETDASVEFPVKVK